MPTDPSDPSSPNPSTRLYQTTPDSPKGGGGGLFFVILLLLVIGGGAAYYFLVYQPAAAAPPAASATPKPTAAPTVAAVSPKPTAAYTEPTYNKTQRAEYIQTAVDSFKALRLSKFQPFKENYAAFITAGGLTTASLSSKEAIAARRDLIKKCLLANDDYAAFIKDQEVAYRDELKKTPLVANDVEVESSYAGAKMPTDKILQLRTAQGEQLKTGDQILAYLDSIFGGWSVNAAKHVVFKKTADEAPYNAFLKTYNEQTTALNKLNAEINANSSDPTAPAASPGTSPAAAPATSPAASPASSPVASAAP